MNDANATVRLLGRDRTPFLPAVVWAGDDHTRIDRDTTPEAWHEAAAADVFLVTQWNDGSGDPGTGVSSSSASMPSLVKRMLDACDVRPGHRVLEVGTGTGYTAALLKDRVGATGHVVTVEVDPDVAASARDRLYAAGVDVHVVCGDGLAAHVPDGPFDRVHVTCGIRAIPASWLDRCPAGKIMLPWGTTFSDTDFVVTLDVRDGVAEGRFHHPVAFMKARSQRSVPWGDWPTTGEAHPVDPAGLSSDQLDDPLGGFGEFVIGLLLPDVEHYTSGSDSAEDGERVLWLGSKGRFASLAFGRGIPTTMAGDTALAVRYITAVRWWHDHGRPEAQGFGLRVLPTANPQAHQEIWFGAPEHPVPTPLGRSPRTRPLPPRLPNPARPLRARRW
ncbi:methyltransferase domain-containing protein [Yinghuangia sp. ASG 101]|uniref:methyltransferase domain-containing protein n=1 Tax=Yinghuangia sp. ASG 101 TaxID=2896848 RepID=UPI001E4E7531|nr:methyltransferase domain-containing protein [Yinghuangia sp. ASG 101]UGQ10417.1 methyltransferase domain-containing protein [Yinghuangia sp. ASG 101]